MLLLLTWTVRRKPERKGSLQLKDFTDAVNGMRADKNRVKPKNGLKN